MANLTPMMQQYFDMKKKYPDTILFFRLGDFYEMFHQDAVTVSEELDLTLTTRDRNKPEGERTPMCGIPYHASEAYLGKLIAKGYKIAICEQTEDPSTTKGLVKREVVRVVTPGTVMEASMLEEGKNNYLAAIFCHSPKRMLEDPADIVLALCDISTGSLFLRNITMSDDTVNDLLNELARFAPTEVVLSSGAIDQRWLTNFLREGIQASYQEGEGFSEEIGERVYEKHFPKEKVPNQVEVLSCMGGLFTFLEETQKNDLSYINSIQSLNSGEFMGINLETRRNLELVETLWSREKKGSLLWVLDKTKTSMGGRLMREWLQRPLTSLSEINLRQYAVGECKNNLLKLSQITDLLKEIPDLERITARIVYGHANAKELRALGEGLGVIGLLKDELSYYSGGKLQELRENLEHLPELTELLMAALKEELPISVREGGMIAEGFHVEVDRLNHVVAHGAELIAELEQKTKEETGIRNLKVRYNRVFGYYIEVAKAQAGGVPVNWVRKQTTVNAERFISEELKDLEHTILTAKDQVTALEYEIFRKLREEVCKFTEIIQRTARSVAELDAIASLGQVASKENYVAPVMSRSGNLEIRDGRHPVVELMIKDGLFVPNDTNFKEKEEICAIITGANMAGKSTYMRQVALIVLMAQIGSFVPAKSAEIGVVDQIFTRIGASDDLAAGRSTFMVEMTEVATLLQRATPRSLLILDEIGRGTSTYDGMAMAKAVLEYCSKKIGAKTLFATHYHELSVVEQEVFGVKNYNIAAQQKGDNILFLRKILPGGADQSYGIQVAKLAGVPEEVIARAHEILAELESGEGKPVVPRQIPVELPVIEEKPVEIHPIIQALRDLDLDNMTPRQAFQVLEDWKEELTEN